MISGGDGTIKRSFLEIDGIIAAALNVADTGHCNKVIEGSKMDFCYDSEYDQFILRLTAQDVLKQIVTTGRCSKVDEALKQSSIANRAFWGIEKYYFGNQHYADTNENARTQLKIYCSKELECSSLVEAAVERTKTECTAATPKAPAPAKAAPKKEKKKSATHNNQKKPLAPEAPTPEPQEQPKAPKSARKGRTQV